MNRHVKADLDAIALTAEAVGERKFFTRSLESSSLREHLADIKLTLPRFSGTGEYRVTAATAVGRLDAAFLVAQWHGGNRPTVIYHHGNNERPFDFSATAAASRSRPI